MPDLKPDNASFNPYAAPRAAVADVYGNEGTTQPVRLFSARGRMGRLRYLGWAMAFGAVTALLLFIVLITRVGTGIFGIRNRVDFMHMLVGAGSVRIGLVVIIFAGWFTMLALMRIQRSHDMGWSGWSVLGMYAIMFAGGALAGFVLPSNPVAGRIIGFAVSFVPWVWYFKPGTPDSNRFGPVPTPTPLAVQILGWIFSVFSAIYFVFNIVRLFRFLILRVQI